MNANKPPTESRRKGERRINPGSHANQGKKGEKRKKTEKGRRKRSKERGEGEAETRAGTEAEIHPDPTKTRERGWEKGKRRRKGGGKGAGKGGKEKQKQGQILPNLPTALLPQPISYVTDIFRCKTKCIGNIKKYESNLGDTCE